MRGFFGGVFRDRVRGPVCDRRCGAASLLATKPTGSGHAKAWTIEARKQIVSRLKTLCLIGYRNCNVRLLIGQSAEPFAGFRSV